MSRRIEPRQVVMTYFATAALDEVRQVLADVAAIVKARTGKPAPRATSSTSSRSRMRSGPALPADAAAAANS